MSNEAIGGWMSPAPSRAQRRIPRQSRGHFVGQCTIGEEKGRPRCVQFESLLEYRVILLFAYHPAVIDIEEQQGPINFEKNGRPARHWLDIVVTERGGRRTGVLVKPSATASKASFKELIERLAAAAVPSFVDRLLWVTEREIDPHRLARAELFHAARFPEPEHDRIIGEAASRLPAPTSLRAFLETTQSGKRGFHAAVRLIRSGALATDAIWPINMETIVYREGRG